MHENKKGQMAEENFWKFEPISRTEEENFNPLITTFIGHGLNALVRENIQNSLDAKNMQSDEPVLIKIRLGEIDSDDVIGIKQIKHIIENLESKSIYTKEAITHMRRKIQEPKVKFLSFEDENTKGLTDKTWSYYAYKKGAHYEEEDDELESIRGGSHGVGKIASNAASDIHVMFFSNYDVNGKKQIGGTAQLLEHKIDGQCFRSTGYFTELDADDFIPYMNVYGSPYDKETRGLKIVIPFLRNEYFDEKGIIRAVCDNFFLAVLTGGLVVDVNNKIINKDTIDQIVEDESYLSGSDGEAFFNKNESELTRHYINTFKNFDPIPLSVSDKKGEKYEFKFYLHYSEDMVDDITKGRVAIVRNIGMKIENFMITGKSRCPFNGVLIPCSRKEDKFLKSLENESHTKITYENINDESYKNNAKRFINQLNNQMSRVLSELISQNMQPDGKIDTGDLIYYIENKFRDSLKKNTSTISVASKRKGEEVKVVVKTYNKKKANSPVQMQTPKEDKNNKSGGYPADNHEVPDLKSSRPLKVGWVKRVVIDNTEKLQFDLNYDRNYVGLTQCNLYLKEVDGSGKISNDRLNIKENYKKIFDTNRKHELEIIDDKIMNVSISDGIIKLDNEFKKATSNSMKYVYFLEVD